ncbi:MAG TPA: response regulator [Candidatus Margulisbacteria bacterium]|nr:MAG: response regulator [Candidatus Margulisbacteria bacterium GWE2_39_32]HCT84177.1 response regulator [Candidatus Margulisiibacteriota bacterium]
MVRGGNVPSRDIGKTIEILLIEDNPGDVRLTREVLKESNARNKLSVASDGEEAMDFLYKRGKYSEAPVPDLILLDLNLPKKDGREVLAEIKNDKDLKRIPVIVLTTSRNQKDIINAYQLNANCYITKPVDLEQFIKVIKGIESFWFSIVELPSRAY